MLRGRIYLLLLLMSLILVGCSSTGNSPTEPATDDQTPLGINGSPPFERGRHGFTGCIEFGQVKIDKNTGEGEIIPLRGVNLSLNVLSQLEPPPYKNLDIDFSTLNIDLDKKTVNVDVIIRHPVNLPFFRAFDVRGIVFGPEVINADGYTTLLNPDDFTGFPYGYQDGLIGTPDEIAQFDNSLDLWGYKYFCDGLLQDDDLFEYFTNPDNLEQRGTFSPGAVNRRHYDLYFGEETGDFLIFNYAILASFHGPTGDKPWEMDDFEITTCNAAESFLCGMEVVDNTLFYISEEAMGGSVSLEMHIGDWQGFSDYDLTIQFNDAVGTIVNPSSHEPGGLQHIEVFHFDSLTPEVNQTGELEFLVTATDLTTTFGQSWWHSLLPEDNQRYNDHVYTCWKFTVPVSDKIPFNPVDITPDYFKPISAQDIFVKDDVAYIAGGNRGLFSFAVSDPANPAWLGRVDTPFYANALWVSGNYAYITGDGIAIYDISNPANPELVGSNTEIKGSDDITIQGDYAYMIQGSIPGGLTVVDVSEPASPTQVSFLHMHHVHSVCVRDDYAFITGVDFYIVDISDPSQPVIISTLETGGPGHKLDVVGDYAYVISSDRLTIIDISDLNAPYFRGQVNLVFTLHDITVVLPYAYIACDCDAAPTTDFGLWVVDVSDPDNPQVAHQCPAPSEANSLFVGDNIAYLTNLRSGLYCMDITNPLQPEFIGMYLTPGYSSDIDFSNDTLVVANLTTGLLMVDVSPPEEPEVIGLLDLQSPIRIIETAGDYIYTYGYYGTFMVVNCANPALPEIWGTVEIGNHPISIHANGNYVYIPHHNFPAGIYLIDVSNPHAPDYIGNYETVQSIQRIYIENDIGYCGTLGDGLLIYDLSNPIQPVMIGGYPYDGIFLDIMVMDNTVYITVCYLLDTEMIILDVSDPGNPSLLSSTQVETGVLGFDLKYGYAFFWGGYEFIIYDVSDPTAPSLVNFWQFESGTRITVRENIAYTKTYSDGVGIIQLW